MARGSWRAWANAWRERFAEDETAGLARRAAAGLAITAGLLHLAQVRTHADEDWRFGAFFLVVGTLQLVGGSYLARPLGPLRLVRGIFWLGIAGSLGTIGVWALSRTLGLPFGAEPGTPETVGLADAAANIFEVLTALLLLVWLRRSVSSSTEAWRWGGAAIAIGLAFLWYATREVGVFDPDPRLVTRSELVDAAAVAFLAAATALFVQLRSPLGPRGLRAALLGSVALTAMALTVFTLPARGGQNLDCRYGPLADDSGLRHSSPPETVPLAVGETKSIVILQLVACSDEPVEITNVLPLNVQGDAADIVGFGIDRARGARAARVAPAGTGTDAAGTVVEAGRGRYPLTAEVRGERDGEFFLHAVRVEYRWRVGASYLPFATFASVCVGHADCGSAR